MKHHWSHTLVPAVILLGPEPDEAEVPLEPWIPTPLAPSATLVTDTFPFIPFALVAVMNNNKTLCNYWGLEKDKNHRW